MRFLDHITKHHVCAEVWYLAGCTSTQPSAEGLFSKHKMGTLSADPCRQSSGCPMHVRAVMCRARVLPWKKHTRPRFACVELADARCATDADSRSRLAPEALTSPEMHGRVSRMARLSASTFAWVPGISPALCAAILLLLP